MRDKQSTPSRKKMFMLIFINLKYDNEVENNKHSTIDRSNLSAIK